MAGFFMTIGGLAVGCLIGRFYEGRKDGIKGYWSVVLSKTEKGVNR